VTPIHLEANISKRAGDRGFVGLSMFTGLTLPQWIADHQSTIHTGLHTSEQQ